jgi:peptide chain release factor 2
MITLDDSQHLIQETNNLLRSFDLVKLNSQKEELDLQLSDPNIWDDNQKATELNQKLAKIQSRIRELNDIKEKVENLEIALELNEEKQLQRIYTELLELKTNLENQKFLNGRFDSKNCTLAVHAGAGGIDAMDWASMLLSMYQSFCGKQNFRCNLVNLSSSEEAGIKSAMLEIIGENAYGLLKEEAGVHRLVRISPFNSGGTRETSFALVEVLPSGLDQEIKDIKLDEKDLKWDYFMSSGKGGQSVNTTYSAVRVTHLPTKISTTCQNQRSQQQNKQEAIKYLKEKLVAIKLQQQQEFKQEIKGDLGANSWGSQIRNYVLHPYKLVKDVRSGWETSDVNKVLEQGEILDIIWSVKRGKKD